MSRDSSVNKVTSYGLEDRNSILSWNSAFSVAAVEANQTYYPMCSEGSLPRIRLPALECDYVFPFPAEV